MSTKFKLLIALLIAVYTISVISALSNAIQMPLVQNTSTLTPTPTLTVLANPIHMPLIKKDPTLTPTPTFTITPSPTATKTPTPKPGVYIDDIVYEPTDDPLDGEYIEIINTKSKSFDLEDWFIKAETGPKYIFPVFTLRAGKKVKVWSGSGENTSTDLYWGSTVPIWKDNHGRAYLKDDEGDLVDTYRY